MEITISQKQKIDESAKKYSLKLVLLFGSHSREEFLHKESDFDIAYLSEEDLNAREVIDLNCDLMDIFNSDRIDLVDLKKTNPFLRYEIAKNCKLLFGDQMEYLEFKAFAFRDYINHQPLFQLRDFLIKKRQNLLRKSIYGK